ncbi:MAG: hypothetical protein JSR48_07905 [Verrucomicrobia bacterium]|nr:hypothetical protein [Verrucomicrobiota bacterium]
MISYNVFFSPRTGTADEEVVAAVRRLLDELKAAGQLRGFRILRVTDVASFPALPRFQVIIDYANQAELDAGLASMRQPGRVHDGAHGAVIRLVTDFRVSFTADV